MRLTLDPDPATVALDDPLADSETDSGARILLLGVESLEHHENPLRGVGFHTDPIVAHRHFPL